MKPVILNSKGEPILLKGREKVVADYNQQICNALGAEVDITTLTTIIKKVTEQKFFTLAPSEFMPVVVGNGAFSSNLLTYRSFDVAGDFETGNINTGASNTRLAEADTAIDSITVKIIDWAKTIGWSLIDVAKAQKAGNWDLISAKATSRKRNWDLGIQKIAFLGSANDTGVLGLLTQSNVTSDVSVITKYIKDMTSGEFNIFLAAFYAAYRVNAKQTAEPTHFIIPEVDYNGLANFPDSIYPLKTRLQIIEETLRLLTKNPNFKVLKCSYCDQAINAGSAVAALGLNRYVFLNYEETSGRIDIPVDYTSTIANSINSFQFQNVGYGEYTGYKVYRERETLYFDWSA